MIQNYPHFTASPIRQMPYSQEQGIWKKRFLLLVNDGGVRPVHVRGRAQSLQAVLL